MSTTPSATRSGTRGDLLIVGVIAAALVGGLAWWLSRRDEGTTSRLRPAANTDVRSQLVGDRACAECHPGEAASHARSGHSRTLRPALESRLAAELAGRSFPDPERPEVRWDYVLRDGQFLVERTEGDATEALTIGYALGSGTHATTFVSLVPGKDAGPMTGFEHRLTHYTHKDPTMGVTPGQDAPAPLRNTVAQGRHLDARDVLVCFGCHSTLTSHDGKARLVPEEVVPNISCESCHGPGRRHIEVVRSGERSSGWAIDFGPGRERAETELRFCGQCHRHPEMAPPGALRPDNREIVRFQPVGLMQSRCYTRAEANLKCTQCHDPHAKASTDARSYNRVCLSCHEGPRRTPCPVAPAERCVECHMPKADAGQGVLFTDHWIRPHPRTE